MEKELLSIAFLSITLIPPMCIVRRLLVLIEHEKGTLPVQYTLDGMIDTGI